MTDTAHGIVCTPLSWAHLYTLHGKRWECTCGSEGGGGIKGWELHTNKAVNDEGTQDA